MLAAAAAASAGRFYLRARRAANNGHYKLHLIKLVPLLAAPATC